MTVSGIRDIKMGRRVKSPDDAGADYYLFTHLLPERLRRKVCIEVEVRDLATYFQIRVYASTRQDTIGTLNTYMHKSGEVRTPDDNILVVEEAHVSEDWRGEGVGKALYSAAYRTAFQLGAQHVRGGIHSTSAHRVHESLANKHNWHYDALPNTTEEGGDWDPEDWGSEGSDERDDKWQRYRFQLTGLPDSMRWANIVGYLSEPGLKHPRRVDVQLGFYTVSNPYRGTLVAAVAYVRGEKRAWKTFWVKERTDGKDYSLKRGPKVLHLGREAVGVAGRTALVMPAQLGTYRPRPSMLDWRDPTSWPTTINLAEMSHDFQVLLGDNFGIEGGTFPLVKASIDEVIIPPVDESSYDDRHYNEETGEHDDTYLATLTELMRNGERFPPAVVGNDAGNQGTKYGWPYDGKHRINAAKRLGLQFIPLIDITGLTES